MSSVTLTNFGLKRSVGRLSAYGRTSLLRRAIPLNRTIRSRLYSQEIPESADTPARSPLRSLLTLILVAGAGATAYGVYEIYGMLTLWPTELRTDLRSGLKARDKGDLALSERFLQRAWNTSKTLPIEVYKNEPHLKTSGIAVLLASVLEANGKHEQAYDIYLESLTSLQRAGTEGELSGPEKLRAIAISYKLGEMAGELQRPEEEEKHLVWAVEAILKSVLRLGEKDESAPDHVPESVSSFPADPDTRTMISELSLPEWATKTDIAAPLEALGAFYAQVGQVNFAMPLYLKAITILVPPEPQESTDEERCRGAQLMANLSELIIRSQSKPSEEILHQAEAWALQGLHISMKAKEKLTTIDPTCELAFAVALFNVAALRRMSGDNGEAKRLFKLSLKQSKSIGLQSGVEHAERALQELEAPSEALAAI
ncbi:hypothetical protein H0H87_008084 [Tephrocybe sp. NHM501043]|nr:hypothetical protein H0H87_008084 [Tephrocybe sp. NHM501043]